MVTQGWHYWHVPYELWERLRPVAREMRQAPTLAEEALWSRLRARGCCGARFRRQHAVERFVLDFYCAAAKLVVEVDGPVHQYRPEHDRLRTEFLEARGLLVLRFRNEQVLGDLDGVIGRIARVLRGRLPTSPPACGHPLSANGEGESRAQ